MTCKDCIKKDVCKYKEQAEKFAIAKDNSIPEFIEIKYECKYKNDGKLRLGGWND